MAVQKAHTIAPPITKSSRRKKEPHCREDGGLNGVAVAVGVFLAAFVAWWCARVLVRRSQHDFRTMDDTWGGLRKLHVFPTPRIGGFAVAAGLWAGAIVGTALGIESGALSILLACAAPAFVWGIIEDLSKRGAVAVRYALTASAAALGYFLLDARITVLHVPGLDHLLSFSVFAFAFTVF